MTLWSKRRAAVAAEERAEAQARVETTRQAEEAALAERPDAELLTEAGVKPPEELACAEEVRDFLKHALPDRLKRRALRRLWGLNPVLANVDGLVDYGEDFTDAAMCVENMQSVYTVGKGMLEQFKALEHEAEALAVNAEEAATAGPEPAAPADPEIPGPAPDIDIAATPADPDPLPQPGMIDPSRRRMRFSFQT